MGRENTENCEIERLHESREKRRNSIREWHKEKFHPKFNHLVKFLWNKIFYRNFKGFVRTHSVVPIGFIGSFSLYMISSFRISLFFICFQEVHRVWACLVATRPWELRPDSLILPQTSEIGCLGLLSEPSKFLMPSSKHAVYTSYVHV